LTDQHAKNVEATTRATQNHANNLTTTLKALEKDFERVEASRVQTETLLRAARQQAAAFEAALHQTEIHPRCDGNPTHRQSHRVCRSSPSA
jgi:septal ring factor EnvC (AmiA/AmiB activator)